MKYERAVAELVKNGLVSDHGFLTEKGRHVLRLLNDRNGLDSAEDFALSVCALVR